ncbi:hypothetical protein O181_084255 [Austropuccinia psidii MF-1]|uniref:Uncharacterized protein n=1 Tax=Austropuccinia psidii MF-1 TaxID=1389203 RepID=A0A9Q3IMB7_9BASI|nr:hypothetical protein [Austropuccinia psidii MF-1]
MNLKYDIESQIRLFSKKMDKINVANVNMPKLSTPPYHIRTPVKPKKEIKNPLVTEFSHGDNNKVLMKEEPQLKERPTVGEVEYDNISFIKTIEVLQEDYAISDEFFNS